MTDQLEKQCSAANVMPVQWFEAIRAANRKYSDFPFIKRMNELFPQQASLVLTDFLRSQISIASMKVQLKTSAALRETANKQWAIVSHVLSDKQTAFYFLLSDALLDQTTNLLFGGTLAQKQDSARRQLTELDKSIAEQFSVLLQHAMNQICREGEQFTSSETKIISADEWLIDFAYSAEFVRFDIIIALSAECEVPFAICCPVALIAENHFPNNEKNEKTADKDWMPEQWKSMLLTHVHDCVVELIAKMPERNYMFKDILALQPGAILPIEDPAAVMLSTSDGLPLYTASVGQSDGKLVLEINKCLFE